MEIRNSSNPKDIVIVEESRPNRKGRVRLGIGSGDKHKPRHANLTPAEARSVAFALLSFASTVDSIQASDDGERQV